MTIIQEWLTNRLVEYDYNVARVKKDYKRFLKDTGSKANYQSFLRAVEKAVKEMVDLAKNGPDEELVEAANKIERQKQGYQDKNRIITKIHREKHRVENALLEYNKELVSILGEVNLSSFDLKAVSKKDLKSGRRFAIFQLSDLHFNELIYPLENIQNSYDFIIASKRLKKYATDAIAMFKYRNITDVLVAITGDTLNSDRRLDEKLNESSNRAKATVLAFYLLEQVIVEIAQSFQVTVATVTGNESRIQEYQEYSDILATDNYDFTLFQFLKIGFRNTPVKFIEEGSYQEKVIVLGDFRLLMLHGDNLPSSNVEKSIQSIIGKYAARNILIDFVIFGHLHTTYVGDVFSRSSSLAGANAYSEYALQTVGRASQTVHIIKNNKEVDTLKISLQNVDDIEGYDIIPYLEAYNMKSTTKLHRNTTIMEIVI